MKITKIRKHKKCTGFDSIKRTWGDGFRPKQSEGPDIRQQEDRQDLVSGFRFQVSSFKFQVSGFRFQVCWLTFHEYGCH